MLAHREEFGNIGRGDVLVECRGRLRRGQDVKGTYASACDLVKVGDVECVVAYKTDVHLDTLRRDLCGLTDPAGSKLRHEYRR